MSQRGTPDEEEIKRQNYYHGMLARDDLEALLPFPGDFLVRLSQVNTKGRFELIVSVRCGQNLRHFVMRRDEKGLYMLRNDPHCVTPLQLVTTYSAKGIPADKADRSSILKRAVPKQSWELTHEMIKMEKKLGEGQFGDVYSGTLQRRANGPKIRVAIKSSKIKNLDKPMVQEITKEARLIRALEHPNVVKLHGIAVEKEPLLIVMELVNGGSLDKYMQNNKQIPTSQRVKMCMDVARGLKYVHAKGLVHRDIAARNCLYNGTTVKIGDFGLSTQVNSSTNAQEKLPIKWLAPEVLTKRLFSEKSDVYAFGVLAWEIFANGQQPYAGVPTSEVQKGVIRGKHLTMPHTTPLWLSRLITSHCWDLDPKERYTMAHVVQVIETNSNAPPEIQLLTSGGRSSHANTGQPQSNTARSRPNITGAKSHTKPGKSQSSKKR
jgi:serine/threonine protein kinase